MYSPLLVSTEVLWTTIRGQRLQPRPATPAVSQPPRALALFASLLDELVDYGGALFFRFLSAVPPRRLDSVASPLPNGKRKLWGEVPWDECLQYEKISRSMVVEYDPLLKRDKSAKKVFSTKFRAVENRLENTLKSRLFLRGYQAIGF